MAIISENKPKKLSHFRSAQFRYALVYIVVTLVALLFLNIYSSNFTQNLFYNNKRTAMIEKCHLVAREISNLDAINNETIANAVSGISVSRLIVTDQAGKAIYDSKAIGSVVDSYVVFPEIITALSANNVFYWNYQDGFTLSNAATPVFAYGTLIGCVYMTEIDSVEGAVILNLENRIFAITLALELLIIVFSLLFSYRYSKRLRKIMRSIRFVREGDYSHRLSIGGNDELNSLGSEFNDLITRLQKSENKRSQFVSDASHELKTPLASIKLLSDSILQNNMDIDTVKEFVGDIGQEAERLNRMSQKLLTLSRTDTQIDSVAEITYIAPTIRQVIRMLSENAKKNDIDISFCEIDDSKILIWEDDLSQVIFNLVENGIKYNRKHGKLEINLFREADNAVIEISDAGIGIPEDALEHIFERFYRVDKARARSTGGSGLGLSIVRGIVERNKGSISVKSQVGVGTTFTLTFPIFDVEEVEE